MSGWGFKSEDRVGGSEVWGWNEGKDAESSGPGQGGTG